jgi:hypothetical protein
MDQPVQRPQYGENIAGRLFDVARQLQKNRERETGFRRPTPVIDKVADGEKVIAALQANKQNEQEQNATSAPGALQEEGGQERGRQRNVGQREEESSFGQGSQVQRTEEEQQRRRMR